MDLVIDVISKLSESSEITGQLALSLNKGLLNNSGYRVGEVPTNLHKRLLTDLLVEAMEAYDAYGIDAAEFLLNISDRIIYLNIYYA